MASNEKDIAAQDISSPAHSTDFTHSDGLPPRPQGWKYKTFKIGPIQTWYASPAVQLVLVALVCFLCPGMFNALGGMGGTGLSNAKAGDEANTALYATFAVIGFSAGTFTNRLGIKVALSFGGMGYCIYVSSFLCFKHTSNFGFSIFAGTLLGICAGLLWSAQGAIMMSYPTERMKGRYISWFWMIFNLGGVIGSLVLCTIPYDLDSLSNVSLDPSRPEHSYYQQQLCFGWHLRRLHRSHFYRRRARLRSRRRQKRYPPRRFARHPHEEPYLVD